jgi:hypothetical protein
MATPAQVNKATNVSVVPRLSIRFLLLHIPVCRLHSSASALSPVALSLRGFLPSPLPSSSPLSISSALPSSLSLPLSVRPSVPPSLPPSLPPSSPPPLSLLRPPSFERPYSSLVSCLCSGFWFGLSCFGFQVSGFVFQISSFSFQVSGFGFHLSGFVF